MKHTLIALIVCISVVSTTARAEEPIKLLLAFSSYKERPKHSNTFFYEHDGKDTGKIIGSIATPRPTASAEGHPSLSQDGRYCAFTYEIENNTGRVSLWDLKDQKLIDMPVINETPNAQMGPAFSADANLIAFTAWNRLGAGEGWHVQLYDRTAKKLLDLPGLNAASADDRAPTLSSDGRWLAFSSNRKGGEGLTDILLYDRTEGKLVDVPGLNSKNLDIEPALSGDGNLIAFSSDRAGGSGGRDIYLYDRTAGKMLPLPGLNSGGHEYSPSLSRDGRFLVFVSERLGGEGERDVYLYDRQAKKLLPTPGLNSKTEDFDPCVIVVSP
jgi:Tol biopolymer transport system component